MTQLVLIPATDDYVTYEATITVANKPTVVLTCSPTPVTRGADVTCTAKLSDNSAFSVLTSTVTNPDGTVAFFSGWRSLQGGKSWESKGAALFSTTVEVTATAKGSTNLGEFSGNTQIYGDRPNDIPVLGVSRSRNESGARADATVH